MEEQVEYTITLWGGGKRSVTGIEIAVCRNGEDVIGAADLDEDILALSKAVLRIPADLEIDDFYAEAGGGSKWLVAVGTLDTDNGDFANLLFRNFVMTHVDHAAKMGERSPLAMSACTVTRRGEEIDVKNVDIGLGWASRPQIKGGATLDTGMSSA